MPSISLFKNSAVGLSVTDRRMEAVSISRSGDSYKLQTKSKIQYGKGVVEQGVIINRDEVKKLITSLLQEAKPTPITNDSIFFGLSEGQVFTHLFTQASDTPITEKIINREARHTIPIPTRDLSVTYKKLASYDEKQEYLITGVNSNVLKDWDTLFNELKLRANIHSSTLALHRGLFQRSAPQPVCIINFDITTTGVHIFSQHGLHYSYVIYTGGENIAHKLSQHLDIPIKKAEQLIHDEGVSNRKSDIFLAIANNLEQTFASIRDTIHYYENNYQEEVSKIILTGYTSNMKGLNSYVERFLSLPVELGFAKELNEPTALTFIEPLGLAHIGLYPNEGIASEPLHVSEMDDPAENAQTTRKTFRRTTVQSDSTNAPNKKLLLLLGAAILFTVIAVAYRWYQSSTSTMPFS